MGPQNNLLVRLLDPANQRAVLRRRHLAIARQPTQIIDALKHDQIPDTRLRQHIPIETRQRIRSQAIRQKTVSSNSLIQHGHGSRPRRTLEPLRENICPAIIAIRRRSVSVRNGVAERDNSGRVRWRNHIDPRQLVPMVDLLRVRKIDSRDQIAVSQIGGSARAGMPRLLRGRHIQMQRHRQTGTRRRGIIDRIGDELRARRYRNIAAAQKLSALSLAGSIFARQPRSDGQYGPK